MERKIKLGSLFDGSGGFPLAGLLHGIEPVWASEIEKFCIDVTSARIPGMKHLGSVTDINGGEIEPVDIITFGSPCFPAGTLVMTYKGYVPIEDIFVGDVVLTHTGQWHKVTAVGAKPGKTVILKGNHYGLECTPNHPIYSAVEKTDYSRKDNGKRNNSIVLTNEREWIPAEDMCGKLWAVPNSVETIAGNLPEGIWNIESLFYFTGRWLGDGWVLDGQRKDRPEGSKYATVYLCDSKDKADELINAVAAISDKYSIEEERTVTKVKFHSRKLCDWLVENFGKYADGKTMPGWIFGMKKEWLAALMKGLLDSDGHVYLDKNEYRISTVSKKLAESIRLLGEILGYSSTVFFTKTKDTTMIEGRTVNQRDYYTVALNFNSKRVHLRDDTHGWYRVRNILPGKETTVWNLTVETDNSYVADGIVVHNCQDLSVAGKQAGIHDGERSNLFFEAIRIIKEMRNATANEFPRFAVWENVPGAFSSNGGEDFRAVIKAFCSVCEENPDVPGLATGNGWQPAGCVLGDGYSIAWKVYDAQYWGVPQRRKRIYLIADFATERAGEILFKSESMCWNYQTGREARERASAYVKGSFDGSDWPRWWPGHD